MSKTNNTEKTWLTEGQVTNAFCLMEHIMTEAINRGKGKITNEEYYELKLFQTSMGNVKEITNKAFGDSFMVIQSKQGVKKRGEK